MKRDETTKARPTPGPWEWTRERTHRGKHYHRISAPKADYMIVARTEPVDPDDREAMEADAADARLIAAAPDLYAALRDAVAWWHTDARNMTRREPGWLSAARAALARAEGQGGAK